MVASSGDADWAEEAESVEEVKDPAEEVKAGSPE